MDYLARIGLVLEDLVNNSTLNGDRKASALTLVEELKAAEDNLVAIVNDRVRAGHEAAAGQIAALEQGRERLDGVVFSTANAASLGLDVPAVTDEETARLRALFNGADPKLFDHNNDGLPGGGLANPPTGVTEDMTVAQLKEVLAARAVEFPSDAKKADLLALVKLTEMKLGAVAVAEPVTGPEAEPVT